MAVYTEGEFPQDWAMTAEQPGITFSNLALRYI
jgi:hypothetical protein